MDRTGELKVRKSIHLKFVLDERICDGFYYASSMRLLTKYLNDPGLLLTPPEKVVIDEGIRKKKELK